MLTDDAPRQIGCLTLNKVVTYVEEDYARIVQEDWALLKVRTGGAAPFATCPPPTHSFRIMRSARSPAAAAANPARPARKSGSGHAPARRRRQVAGWRMEPAPALFGAERATGGGAGE